MEYREDPQGKSEESVFEDEKSYSFMQETIKDEGHPVKKTTNLILKYIGLGLAFGMAASLGFCALKPQVESWFQKDPEEVSIQVDEDEQEDAEENQDEAEEEQKVVVEREVTVEDYRELNRTLVQVAQTAKRCVVEIIAETENAQWQNSSYNEKHQVSGVLLADNGREYLVLAKSSIVKDAANLQASFADGRSYPAKLKVRDGNTGLAVFSVNKQGVKEVTRNSVDIAKLGSSNAMKQGDIVLALGSPFSYADGMGFGIVASSGNEIQKLDGAYGILNTDIAGAAGGTGVLVNIRGEIVGIIDQSLAGEVGGYLITAYGVSDLKMVMDILSNGKPVPYIGIKGVTVTEKMANEFGIVQGVYVQEVAADSPAMEAGIQCGDILTNVNGEDIALLSVYNSRVLSMEVGQKIKLEGQRLGAGGYVDIDFEVTVGSLK